MDHIAVSESEKLPVWGDFDVAVIGGGVAGCAAAIAASRDGKHVVLVEKQCVLGGLATSGHVVIYLPLCDGYGHQVITGIAEEFLWDSIRYSYGDDNRNWQGNKRLESRFNGPAFALALEEKLLAEGVELRYDTLFSGALIRNGHCEGIITEDKSGRGVYLCKAAVDASGDAELFARAGFPCAHTENNLAIWTYATSGDRNILKRGSAEECGLKLLTIGQIDTKASRDLVTEPYYGDSAEAVNRFLLDGHRRLLNELKADPEITLASLPGMAQIRMARRIEGSYTLRKEDLSGHFTDNIGASGDWRKPAPVYEIPFRSLYCEGLGNVLAAGRCISMEGEAWEVIRAIPACALTGQAAGTAAAMLAESGRSARELPVDALHGKLATAGVQLDYNNKQEK